MTNHVAEFGDRSRFHVRFQWLPNDEPVSQLPASHGWSMGKLELTVANRNLMAHSIADHRQDELCWYFGPLFHWLAENWIFLFHEEHFTWRELSHEASAVACEQAMTSTSGDEAVAAAQEWYFRHAISAAAVGGLFPDIFLRRFSDDVEISWTGLSSPFAPGDFTFVSEPGRIYLSVEDVALPLWNMLHWIEDNPPELLSAEFYSTHDLDLSLRDAFCANYRQLIRSVQEISSLDAERFQRTDMHERLFGRVQRVFNDIGRPDLLAPVMHECAPFVVSKSPAMAMFGGIDVDISEADVAALRDVLISATDGEPSVLLLGLIEDAAIVGEPWQVGYDLAEDLLHDLEDSEMSPYFGEKILIEEFCRELHIEVMDCNLETRSVRGVALAGVGLRPVIVVNKSSIFNRNEKSRRFTVAHELCHILHDQSRARRLAHISGPWASPAVEQRANAFAAWLLMPRHLLAKFFVDREELISIEDVRQVAERLLVTNVALIWHLYNLGFIQDSQREILLTDLSNAVA